MKLTPQDTSPPSPLLENVGPAVWRHHRAAGYQPGDPGTAYGWSVIGPDGVGKSSLLSLIAGARAIEQGNVMVLGGDMRDVHHRRDVCPKIALDATGAGEKPLSHPLGV